MKRIGDQLQWHRLAFGAKLVNLPLVRDVLLVGHRQRGLLRRPALDFRIDLIGNSALGIGGAASVGEECPETFDFDPCRHAMRNIRAIAGCDGDRESDMNVMDDKGKASIAVLEIKYHRMTVCPPIGKEKRYGKLELTVIHATERGTPKDRKPIRWKLVTNLPIRSHADAIEKLR